MSFYNTGNPVPSIDPRDLDDNAKVLDGFSNSASPTFIDRLGVERQTIAGIINDNASLATTLQNSTDPTKGASRVGWTRSPLASRIDNAHKALDSHAVSAWEFENLITSKPNPSDTSTWDWAPAVNAALVQHGECKLILGKMGIATPIVMRPGTKIFGHGPRYAGGTEYSNIFGSTLVARSDFVGSSVISSSVTAPDNVLTSISLREFRLDLNACAEHGIVLTDIYDGALLENLHIIGSAINKRGLWFAQGAYGLGQTVNMRGVQVVARDNSTATVAPFRADALNESVFTNCKFFGSFGGVNASLGACAELSGCGGLLFDGCSTAFGDVGISLVDHATRKNYGIAMNGCTFEALRTTALKVRGSSTRKATQIYIRSPRYYDSVFTFTNAIDIDFVEQSIFECSFKRAIIASGADQCTVTIQRQNFVTNSGTNILVQSQPNAIETDWRINKRIGALGGVTATDTILANGGIGQKVSVFSASPAVINKADRIILVNRATLGTYTLPPANSFGAGLTQVVTIRGIGAGSIAINPDGSDLIEGLTTLSIATGGKVTLASDGVSNWYSI